MIRQVLLLSVLPVTFAAGCDCTTPCLTTGDSPSVAWCAVDSSTCTAASYRYDAKTAQYISYKTCDGEQGDPSKECVCEAMWTADVESSTSSPSTCNTTQAGCPDTACNNIQDYAYWYGYSSWCVVANAPCKDVPANPSGSAFAQCKPIETASSCDCLASWDYEGTTYTGCQTTAASPSAPWCMVDWTCNTASFGFDTSTNTSFPYKSCSDGLNPSVTCACDAAGCVNAATPYCVAGNTPCDTAPPPGNGVEAYITCTPNECECQASWSYQSGTYTGCSTTPDSPGLAWCFVNSDTCASAYDKNDTAGITSKWKLCSGGVDTSKTCTCSGACMNEATPYCELGNAPCSSSPPPNPAGKAYGTCTPSNCECLSSWSYNGTAHSGCDGAYDANGFTWCAVDQSCASAAQATDPSNSAVYYAVYCSVPPATGAPATGAPATSAPTPNPPGTTSAPTRDPCDCLPTWYYNNTYYNGCQTTRDGTTAWCMIDGSCPNPPATGVDATNNNLVFYYKTCTDGQNPSVACTCAGECVNANTPYCEVSNAPCDVAPAANPAGVGEFMYCVPDACRCQDTWTYKSVQYTGCSTTPDSPSNGWCYVSDGCSQAYDKNVTAGIEMKWRTCSDGVDSSKKCTCSGACMNEATPYCELGNAPCDMSPPPNPAGKAYGTCTPSNCECLSSWSYNGTAHSGCDGAYDANGFTWCAVDQSCASAAQATDPSNSAVYYAVYCSVPTAAPTGAPVTPNPPGTTSAPTRDPCDCLPTWYYNNTYYNGCQTTRDGTTAWCMIDGSCPNPPATGVDVTNNNLVFYYKTCTDGQNPSVACTCAGECVNANTPYCEVSNAPCDVAPAANPAGVGEFMYCVPDACRCQDTWTYKSVQYTGCSTTPDSPSNGWCYVSDGCSQAYDKNVTAGIEMKWRTCSDGVDSSKKCTCSGACMNEATPYCELGNAPCDMSPPPNPAGKAYGTCVPEECECKDSWAYDGIEHKGCDGTKDASGYIWCVVADECISHSKVMDPATNVTYATRYCDNSTARGAAPESDDGWSTGAIVAVTLGSVFALIGIAAVVYHFTAGKGNSKPNFKQELVNEDQIAEMVCSGKEGDVYMQK